MQRSLLTGALCAVAFSAAALAQNPPAAPASSADAADLQAHRAEMCADRYAHQVGEIAYLEAKLALSDAQKRLFDRWKAIKLTSAKARTTECAAMKPPAEPPAIVDVLKQEEKMLQSRLADLTAELPAFEALAASLTVEQKRAFEHRSMMGPMDGPHHMRGPHMGEFPPPDRPDGPPPPDAAAPPQN